MPGKPEAADRSPAKSSGESSASDRLQPIPPGPIPDGRRSPGAAGPGTGATRPEGQGTPPAAGHGPEEDFPFAAPTQRFRGQMHRLRSRMPWLFRRGWVLVVVTVLVTATAVGVSGLKSATYSSDAILLVNPGATNTSPGSSQEAQALASTYAGLIPSDNAVLGAVSAATGLTQDEVKSGATVTVVNGTSLLDLRFSNTRASTAVAGVTAMSQAISGKHPVSAAIPAGTMTVVHGASAPASHTRKLIEVVIIGLLLGLLLGAVIVTVWERADARFDRPGQVTGQLGIPARSLRHLNIDSATAMSERWRTLAIIDRPIIALLSGVVGMQDTTEIVGRRLAELAPNEQCRIGGAPGDENGDRVAQFTNLTVLLIPREARVREVLRSVEFLGQIGVVPAWALMIDEKLL